MIVTCMILPIPANPESSSFPSLRPMFIVSKGDMMTCYLSSSSMGPISGGSTKKRVRKYGAMARVSITFIVALRSEVKQL